MGNGQTQHDQGEFKVNSFHLEGRDLRDVNPPQKMSAQLTKKDMYI